LGWTSALGNSWKLVEGVVESDMLALFPRKQVDHIEKLPYSDFQSGACALGCRKTIRTSFSIACSSLLNFYFLDILYNIKHIH
jgi:hypothetical protein